MNSDSKDESMYSLLTEEEFDRIENTNRLYRGDTVINIRRPSSTPTPTKGEKDTKDTKDTSDTSKKSKGTKSTIKSNSDPLKDELEYKLEEQETISFLKSLLYKVLRFFRKIFEFFYNIDYSDRFIQLSIIVGIFYLLSTAISILHINVNI